MQHPIAAQPPSPTRDRRERHCSIDALKVVCCVSVILLHALVWKVERVDDSLSWMLANLLSSATRQAVPVFFMMSGALLLRKDIVSYRRHFQNIGLRYAIPLFGGLFTYKALAIYQGDHSSLFNTVLYNVRNNLGFHLWFMWAFLGLVIIAPLLRPMVAQRKASALFLALWALYCVIAPWLLFWGITIPVDNMLFMRFTGYFVLGHFLMTAKGRVSPVLLGCAVLVSVLGTAAATAELSLAIGHLDPRFYDASSPLLLVLCACLFKLFLQSFPGSSPRLLRTLAGATFTVYIYHVLALSILSRLIGPTSLGMSLFVHTPLAFAACLLLYVLGRRLPVLRAFFPG